MKFSELIGYSLLSVRTTYRGGRELLTLGFADKDDNRFRVTIEAERGSDLWTNIRKVNKKNATSAG